MVATDPHLYAFSEPGWETRPTSLAAGPAGPHAARVNERTVARSWVKGKDAILSA